MNIVPHEPPREFTVGQADGSPKTSVKIVLRDCARIELEANEQVTFVTERGAEYDVLCKDWGFVAVPSMNVRLASFGLWAALVMGFNGRLYVMLVDWEKEADFNRYLEAEGYKIVCWLATDAAVNALEKKMA